MPLHEIYEALNTIEIEMPWRGFQTTAGWCLGIGTTVGGGFTDNWAPGALYIDVDAAAGANFWRNDGTATTASWKAVAGEAFLDSEELTFGTAGSSDSGIQYDGSNLIINSATPIHFKIAGIGALAIDDAAISGFAGASDTAGTAVYIESQDGGAVVTAAKNGGLISIKTGDGGASAVAFAAGQGGAASFTGGAGGANTGAAAGQAGGAGGTVSVTAGAGGATNSTGAHDGGAGGSIANTTGAGGAATAGTGAGGAGGNMTEVLGAGGASVGGVGGAGASLTTVAGIGGAVSGGSSAGGLGGSINLTASAGGAVGAGGTGDGGDGGSIVLTPGAGGAAAGGGAAGAAGAIECAGVVTFYAPAPATVTTAATLTTAGMIGGIIVGTHPGGGTVALTLPTGTVMSSALEVADHRAFDFTIINLSSAAAADTYTLTAASGFTIVGNAIIETSHAATLGLNSGTFRCRKSAANTWIAYRIG